MRLERFADTPFGAFGRIYIGGEHWFTVERPWADNEPKFSCVPEGCYPLIKGRYNRGGYEAYEIMDVPGRTEIKIHVANTMEDVLGCVGIGLNLCYINDRWAIGNSKIAFEQFMSRADKNPELTKSIFITRQKI